MICGVFDLNRLKSYKVLFAFRGGGGGSGGGGSGGGGGGSGGGSGGGGGDGSVGGGSNDDDDDEDDGPLRISGKYPRDCHYSKTSDQEFGRENPPGMNIQTAAAAMNDHDTNEANHSAEIVWY